MYLLNVKVCMYCILQVGILNIPHFERKLRPYITIFHILNGNDSAHFDLKLPAPSAKHTRSTKRTARTLEHRGIRL
jgi:hypothetical protein